METSSGKTPVDLSGEALLDSPQDWSYFSLLQMLEASIPGAAPLGDLGPVAEEAVRLRGHPALAFPAREVITVQRGLHPEGRPRFELEVAGMTLYGVDTPLPLHISEHILRTEDTAVRDFLDVFNHRILSLLYRIWGRYRLHTNPKPWGEDALSASVDDLLDLPGVPMALKHAGIFFQRPRSAAGLELLLRSFFPGFPISIAQCLPREIELDPRQQCQLGQSGCQLGEDLLLGERILEVNGAFRVTIGPLPPGQSARFVPEAPEVALLHALVDAWCQEPLDWEFEILQSRQDVQATVLSGDAPQTQLGVNSWLGSPPQTATTTLRPDSP